MLPKDATFAEFLIGTLICSGVAGAFGMLFFNVGYFLIRINRSTKILKAREEKELQQLLVLPLTEIRPTQASLKADEKAYGSVMANLQENKTVGYSAGTTGISVRVAKDVTANKRYSG